jgi:hypothetical protein
MFNFENITAAVNYERTVDAMNTRAFFNGVNQVSSPYNSQFADETLSFYGSYGRSFFKYYKASLNAILGWSKYNNIQIDRNTLQDVPVTNESFTQSYTIRASTNFKKWPNIELGYNYSVNDYPTDTFFTDRPTVKLDYFFLKSFSFVSEYEFYHYYNNDKSVENEYDFLSASLIYQKTKDSKWEYKISASNLLNTTSLNDDNFSQFSTRTSQYRVQPRYVMLTLKYNL